MLRHSNIYRIKPIGFGGPSRGFYCVLAWGFACGRAYFLLLRQKKVAKEKATPGYAVGVANSPALLEAPGGCGTRGFAPQTVLAEGPRPFSVARRSTRGPKGGMAESGCRRIECCGRLVKKPKIAASDLSPLTPSLPRRRESRLRLDPRLRGDECAREGAQTAW